MVELYLIRHGKTYGNTLGRYIGTTDESLCREGAEAIQSRKYPEIEVVYASPMKRCIETARLIWPQMEPVLCADLRECDFGEFENKNYKELEEHPAYQEWVDSNGMLPFPGGESREDFKERCKKEFLKILEDIRVKGWKRAALVVHGGTIMSILEAYAEPFQSFYDWQVKNGQGYRMLWDETIKGNVRLNRKEKLQ